LVPRNKHATVSKSCQRKIAETNSSETEEKE
jgi:hypothetical protein